jgi:predicted nucleotidyltransferase
MDLKKVVESLLSWFQDNNINYALIGGFALHAYGYVRATRDIDFLVLEKEQNRIITYLEQLGFETINRSQGYSNHIHSIGTLRVDFVYVDDFTGDKIFCETDKKVLFENLRISIVSERHLIALKLFAAKNDPERKLRELADIKELVKIGHIDKLQVIELLSKYGFEEWIEEVVNAGR